MAAATVYLSESNGAGPTVTDNVNNINFGGADTPNLVPGTHPVVRATSGRSASFNKQLRVKVDSMGDSALLNHWKTWKSSGVLLTAENVYWDNDQAYSQPVNTINAGADGQSYPTSEPGGFNISVSGVPGGDIIAAPNYTDYILIQLVIGSTTPLGAVNQKTFVFQWDES